MDSTLEIIRLLRTHLCEGQTDSVPVPEEELPVLLRGARRHQLAHLLCRCGVDCPETRAEENRAKYRFMLTDYEFRRICAAFEEARIVFLPLKGIVLKREYPEPWMRTQGDMDILVQDHAGAQAVLSALGYVRREESDHDVSFYLPDGSMHIELAYTLTVREDCLWNDCLARVWDYTKSVPGAEYQRAMEPEFFYFYHIAHMAKHFSFGGIGIRYFLDLWIMRHRAGICGDELCAAYGLGAFNDACVRLSEKWFSGAEGEPPEGFKQAVIAGGIYGISRQRITFALSKKSRSRYLLSRLFPSFDYMTTIYPVLKKHKWLLPLMYLVRLFRPLTRERFGGRVKNELSIERNVTETDRLRAGKMLEELGLAPKK